VGAGVAEIASALYRNTSVKVLDLTRNGLNDLDSVNVLHELMRRNKTITKLCIGGNAFGRNITAVRSIAEGVRSNATLEHLGLEICVLDDQCISVLASGLGLRDSGLAVLNLCNNYITSVGVLDLTEEVTKAMNGIAKLSLSRNRI
jgi:hypothetical protein